VSSPDELTDELTYVVVEVIEEVAGSSLPNGVYNIADLDLEEDLSVDAAHRAEVFDALRERFGLPQIDGSLRGFRTVGDLVRYFRARGLGDTPGTGRAGRSPNRDRRKAPTPAGKVKASFNLLLEDLDSLRIMAARLGTSVTSVLQRAIRDERFVQDELAKGNRFAVVDQQGNAREIIWR
jgi:hypothetical protein